MNVTIKVKGDLGVRFDSIGIGYGLSHRDDYYIKISGTEAIRYSPNSGTAPKVVNFSYTTRVLPLPDTEIIFK